MNWWKWVFFKTHLIFISVCFLISTQLILTITFVLKADYHYGSYYSLVIYSEEVKEKTWHKNGRTRTPEEGIQFLLTKSSPNLRTSRSREKGKWSPIKEALRGLHTFFLVAPEKMHRELWGDVCSDVRVQRMNVYLMWVVVCFQELFILSNNYYWYIPRLSLNKASTVTGWFLVMCPWSYSNVFRLRYNCTVVAHAPNTTACFCHMIV